MRLFFAVELPDEVKAALGRLQVDDPGYRWVEPGSMHVTLAFLGEQPETALPNLEEIASAATASARPGTLRLGQAGSFGPRNAPRVLWVGLEGDLSVLSSLQVQFANGLRQAGFAIEDREWRPHITLARRREHATSRGLAWPPKTIEHKSFALDSLVLFQSKLSPRGPTYVPLREFELGG